MPPKRKHQIYDNYDEGVKVIKFKKLDIDDRDEAIKTLKILPEETESVICDIYSAALKSEAWLEHHKKSSQRIICLQCGVSKSSAQRLRDHMRDHIKVVCHKCGKFIFRSKSSVVISHCFSVE